MKCPLNFNLLKTTVQQQCQQSPNLASLQQNLSQIQKVSIKHSLERVSRKSVYTAICASFLIFLFKIRWNWLQLLEHFLVCHCLVPKSINNFVLGFSEMKLWFQQHELDNSEYRISVGILFGVWLFEDFGSLRGKKCKKKI